MGSDSFTTQNAAGGGGDKTKHTHTHIDSPEEKHSLLVPTIAHGPHNLLLSPPSPFSISGRGLFLISPPSSNSPVAAKTIHIEAGGQA